LFHAYLLLPEVRTQNRPVTDRLKGGMGYLRAKIRELELEVQSVRDELIERGFAPARVRVVFRPREKEVLDAIIDLHRRERFNLIVLSRRPGRIGRFFAGSLHTKLISALTHVTICVVS
jgi:nucleotide-binding universal stress UspA family protein